MQNQIPKFQEAFIPVLHILAEDGVMHYKELERRVVEKFFSELSPELLQQRTRTGHVLISNRIGWARVYLKQAALVSQPERAMVQITDKGREILKKGSLTLKELLNNKDFLTNRKLNKESQKEEEIIEDATPQDRIDSGFHAIELQVKIDLLARLKTLDPYLFQRVILILLQKMGYGDFEETSRGADGGIDGIINQDRLGVERIYMQAKRYADGQVGGREMTNFIGAITRDRVRKGIFVTTSTFGQQALENAKNAGNVILVDGEKLVELMMEYNVGVQIRSTYEVKEVDEDFFEEE